MRVNSRVKFKLKKMAAFFRLLFGTKGKAFIQSAALASPVFIIGSGRSGTHFLARSMIQHADIHDWTHGKENDLVFHDIVNAALKGQLPTQALKRYRWVLRAVSEKIFLDQSHPNIWFVEKLEKLFPDARFILIVRRPESVIFSMKNHSGTADWTLRWETFPHPNRFLGTTVANFEDYRQFNFIQRSAQRWYAHFSRALELKRSGRKNIFFVDYDELVSRPAFEMSKIQDFLGLGSPFPIPEVSDSSSKWRQLSAAEIEQIRKITGSYDNLKSELFSA